MSSTPIAARAAAFFDNWRHERRQATQQQEPRDRDPEAPSSASSIVKDALPSLPSINVGGVTSSPANKRTPSKARNLAPVTSMAPRSATSSASKPSAKSSPASNRKNAATTRDDYDVPTESDTDDEGESYAVRDQIVAEEPALWDPPFATTPSKPKTPARMPNPRRNRAARRSSPILGASSDAEEPPKEETPEKVANNVSGDKQEREQEQEQADNDGDAGARDGEDVSQKKYSLKSIMSHRPQPGEPNIFELLVRWASPSESAVETWEPEETLHRDAPRALFAYWRRVGGREDHMQDPTLWYIEGVTKHRVGRGGKVELSVSWVGSPETNWEREERVEDIAPLVLEEYWEEKGGRANVFEKKRKAAAGRKGGAKKARK